MSDDNIQGGEETTNVDALEATLGDLLKAADATDIVTDLRKASASGKGKIEGGRGNDFADEGDAGKTDAAALMYGKMAQLGIEGVSMEQAGALAAFMHGKGGFPMASDDEDPSGKAGGEFGGDDDEDDEEEEQPVGKRRGGAPLPFQKSFSDVFEEDEDIAKAVNVAPFLEALTSKTTEALDTLNKSMRSNGKRQDKVNKAMAAALYQTAQLVKSQARIIGELGHRLGVVESTPVAPKGATGTLTGARPLAKSMGGGEVGSPNTKLNKREIVSTLSYMNIEKGVREIGGIKTSEIVCKAESGVLPKSVLETVHTFLKAHPMEADAAKSYA